MNDSINSTRPNSVHSKWFFFTIFYIVLDHTRIYEELHLGFLRPLMIVTLILVYFIFSSGEYYRAKSKQITYMWLFIFLLACYIPFARNNHFAYITTKAQLLYMPLILSLIICIDSIERLKKLLFFLICVEIYIAVYALTHAGHGPGNYFVDENDLALYINMWLPFCYFSFFHEKQKKKKLFYGAGIVVGIMSVVASFSRGGFIGLVAMAFVAWLFSSRKIVSMIAICLFGCILYIYAGEAYRKEMSTTTDTQEGTGRERIESWKSAWRMFLDNPLGVGGNNFQFRFSEYQTDYFKKGMWGRVAHSLWFTLIPELGLVGIFIYLSLLYYNLKAIFFLKSIKANDDPDLGYFHFLSLAFIASLAGYFASASFLSVLYYPHYWYLTAILVATKRLVADNMQTSHSVNLLLNS